jgi:16S rRNA (uracil1498-N3)-methyltransferase
MLRLYVGALPAPLAPQLELDLPEAAARHVQVRRLQPGDKLVLFDGAGQDWPCEVLAMGRREVRVRVGEPVVGLPELPLAVTLACGMPANERMDALVEKAAELGAAALQPLICERSVLRLAGERAERRREHWQAVSASASEQSGRARVMQVHAVQSLQAWLAALGANAAMPLTAQRIVLSTGPGHQTLPARLAADAASAANARHLAGAGLHHAAVVPVDVALAVADAGPSQQAGAPTRAHASAPPLHLLSGPEGGFSPAEDAAAVAQGFQRASLGPRVLRADTAPLVALAWLSTQWSGRAA